MHARSLRATWPVRLALVVVVGVAAAAAALVVLMWAKAPAASAQQVDGPANEPAFVVRCDFSHRNNDDPIVYPGVQGAAHSHDFFGNTSTNYASTYNTLQAAGTTCVRPADKASYWIPTVKWNGKPLKPQFGTFYYRGHFHDPATVQAYPAGLKVISGALVRWQCLVDGGGAFTSEPPTRCSSGVLRVRVNFPDCSNGQTESAYPHRSHLAWSQSQGEGTYNRCPETHPTPVPMLAATIRFRLPTTRGEVTLSSGAPSTMHADFFNSWDQAVLKDLVATCIRGFDPSQPTLPEKCRRTSL